MKVTALVILLAFCMTASSQNPATVFNITNRNISLACGVNCTSITVTVPHIKQSDDYIVTSIPYLPFSYRTTTGNELMPLYNDDVYSSKISLPFQFCFFGTTYEKLVVGSNSVVSFDTTNANCDNAFTVSQQIPYSGGTQCFQFFAYYPKASIFGPYHDIDPRLTNTNRKIEWRIEGDAPNRRFIASYSDVPLFSCNSSSATHQMVIYEGTGIVEVYLKSKPVCPDWNNGKAILGMQNFSRNKAVTAAGKNATQWGTENMNEAYRFTPSGGTSKFKRAELILNGNVVALADSAAGNIGDLTLNFPDVCVSQDSSAYILKVYYSACDNASEEISFQDTIFIKRPNPGVTFSTQNALCTGGGSITVNATGFLSRVQYSLNGGAFQASNEFKNLSAGAYLITTKDDLNCTVTTPVTVALTNNLSIQTMPDTTVCHGVQFTTSNVSNGSSFLWTPSSGISSSTILNPTITANQTTTYSVSAVLGACSQSSSFTVNVLPVPNVSAGAAQTILEGDAVQLQAIASPGSYLWSPAAGLSATNVLNPIASPRVTTTYTLTATNAEGCKASDTLTITVVPYCVQPMDAFTPNNDGINDLWLITNGNCLITAQVQVFNRYGAKVYENNNYKNNWNGTYNGKPLADGTYYYIINYELINGARLYKKGNVTILR